METVLATEEADEPAGCYKSAYVRKPEDLDGLKRMELEGCKKNVPEVRASKSLIDKAVSFTAEEVAANYCWLECS